MESFRRVRIVLLLIGLLVCLAVPGLKRGTATDREATANEHSNESPTPEASVVSFSETRFDLGRVAFRPSGEATVVDVPFRNTSDSPLRIRGFTISCGCTSAESLPAVVAPGETGTVRLHIGTWQRGPQSVQVTVAFEEPRRTSVPIRVSWNSVSWLETEPGIMDFGTLRPGESTVQRLRFRLSEFADPATGAVSADAPSSAFLSCRVSDDDSVEVTLVPGKESGDFRDAIVLRSEASSNAPWRIPVTWSVRREVECQPVAEFVGRVQPGQSLTGRFTVSSVGGDFELPADMQLTCDGRDWALNCRRLAAKQWLITATTTAPGTPGPFRSELRIPVEHSAQTSVDAVLTGYVHHETTTVAAD